MPRLRHIIQGRKDDHSWECLKPAGANSPMDDKRACQLAAGVSPEWAETRVLVLDDRVLRRAVLVRRTPESHPRRGALYSGDYHEGEAFGTVEKAPIREESPGTWAVGDWTRFEPGGLFRYSKGFSWGCNHKQACLQLSAQLLWDQTLVVPRGGEVLGRLLKAKTPEREAKTTRDLVEFAAPLFAKSFLASIPTWDDWCLRSDDIEAILSLLVVKSVGLPPPVVSAEGKTLEAVARIWSATGQFLAALETHLPALWIPDLEHSPENEEWEQFCTAPGMISAAYAAETFAEFLFEELAPLRLGAKVDLEGLSEAALRVENHTVVVDEALVIQAIEPMLSAP